MIIKRGIPEILEMINNHESKSFNDFVKIIINTKKLSSVTVSKRLDELIGNKSIEEVITRSTTGRRIIAYKRTEKGKKLLEQIKQLDEALTKSKNN